MMESSVAESSFGTVQIAWEVRIAARPKRVWAALTRQTGKWWPKEFYTADKAKGFKIEPKVGGRMYEDWGDGDGRLWGVVIGVKTGSWIDLLGYLSPAYGGPAHTNYRFDIVREGDESLVKVTDTIFGAGTGAKRDQTREGWRMLLEGALKPYVEASSSGKKKSKSKAETKTKSPAGTSQTEP